MNYADRVKETTLNTSMAVVTLQGAVSKFRPFLNSEIAVGAKRIPVLIIAATGEWECGFYTLTNATTLTREALVSSSNGNAAVTFPAGSKEVSCSMISNSLRYGLVDPDDVGFDIIGCFGQSNMQGNPAWDPLIDVGDPGRVFQWANYSADSATYRKIITALTRSTCQAAFAPASPDWRPGPQKLIWAPFLPTARFS